MTPVRAVASSILLSLLVVGGLTACDPAAPSDDTAVDAGSNGDESSSSDENSSDDDGFAGVTLAGSGDYAVPDDAPIGGFELPDNDSLPDGCTWTIYVGDDVLAESNGTFVFLTDVTTRFVTNDCPDWVQFE